MDSKIRASALEKIAAWGDIVNAGFNSIPKIREAALDSYTAISGSWPER